MCRIYLAGLMFLICILPSSSISQITLSEVMFDPDESEYYYEFIELFNLSETDSVDLTGFTISDGNSADEIIPINGSRFIKPLQYGIILDPGYFDHVPIYDHLISPEALVLSIFGSTFGDAGLSNTIAETIFLIDSYGHIISSYQYSLGNPEGHSDEKILIADSNIATNWADSRTLHGSPGAPNTISPLGHDLSLSLTVGSDELASNTVLIYAHIKNIGLMPAADFTISIFQDSSSATPQLIFEEFYDDIFIAPFDSITFLITSFSLAGGSHRLLSILNYSPDLNNDNNECTVIISTPFKERELIINELMYAPHTDQPEWIELYNPSKVNPVNLCDWKISDSQVDRRITLCDEDLLIMPEQFVLISQSPQLSSVFMPMTCPIISLGADFPGLNNTEDVVVLYDLTDNQIDCVQYSSPSGYKTGISLERFNPYLTSGDPNNWSYSADDRGATPGFKNSIFVERSMNHSSLVASPNPFSPDGDGLEDITIIEYSIPLKTARIDLRIFDIRGRMIRFLCNNDPTGSQGAVIWNGRDDEDTLCRIGIYIIHLTAINESNAALIEKTATVVLASRM